MLRAPIRTAYQVVEPAPRLQQRDDALAPAGSVQVVAIGKPVTIVAAGTSRPAFGLPSIADEGLAAALKRAFTRVGR